MVITESYFKKPSQLEYMYQVVLGTWRDAKCSGLKLVKSKTFGTEIYYHIGHFTVGTLKFLPLVIDW